MKYPKHVIALWVVILLVAAPSAYFVMAHPQEALTYDVGSGGISTESTRGNDILSDVDYFSNGNSDPAMMLVVEYPDAAGLAAVTSFNTAFAGAMMSKYDVNGQSVTVLPMGNYSKTGTNGVFLIAINFSDGYKPSSEVENVREMVSAAKVSTIPGQNTYVTGGAAIYHDTEVSAMEDVKKIDPFTVILILILIGLFFRSLISSTTPPIVIGFAYAITLMAVLGLAQVMSIYYITSTLVLVSMLGAGCDYCIFIMARYREELKSGKDHHDSLRESITWAGESITISGCSVIIGFGALSICSYHVISTMGIVLAFGIVFALLAALTLIPAIIALVGEKIFWPSKVETYKEGSKAMKGWYGRMSRAGTGYFKASSRFAMRHAGTLIAASLLVTVPLAYVTMTEGSSFDSIAVMPNSESKDGVNAIVDNAQGGVLMPTYILLEAENSVADLSPLFIESEMLSLIDPDLEGQFPNGLTIGVLNWDATYGTQYRALSEALAQNLKSKNDNVGSASVLIYWNDLDAARQAMLLGTLPESISESIGMILELKGDAAKWNGLVTYASSKGITISDEGQIIDYILNHMAGGLSKSYGGRQYIKTTVIMNDVPTSDRSMETIGNIREIVADTIASDSTFDSLMGKTYVTGSTAQIYDVSKIVNDEFTLIEILVMVLIFLLLFFVMKSYITPLRAILTIVMSIVWTLGLTHLLFTGLLGMPVNWIVPIILFVVCLGLGMDYDILLTTRIRENVSKGMSNDEAIAHAVESTGAVITICGIIMSSAFGTMVLSSSPMLQQFGFALWFAILVDALLVRTYLVPAVMHLLGRWNWVGPKWLQNGEYDHIHEESK